MIQLKVKPMSVNYAWQGKRFKTREYKIYQLQCMVLLPKIQLPNPPYKIYYEFGFSNNLSDWDNPVKPFQDILQKKYGFNDNDIMEAHVKKVIVPKGKEYIKFEILPLN